MLIDFARPYLALPPFCSIQSTPEMDFRGANGKDDRKVKAETEGKWISLSSLNP